jgi:hypothetical protein
LISSTGHPWENHRPATVHWQTWSHQLDIPEKTIDLPQFTDKLDLINWHPWENHRPATVHWQTWSHQLDIPEKTIDLPQFTDKLELYGVHLVTGNNQTHNLMVMADANSIRMRSWRQCLLLIKIIYVRNVLSVKAW